MISESLGIVSTGLITLTLFILRGFDARLGRIENILMSRRKTDEHYHQY